MRHAALVRLHAVVAAGIGLGLVVVSRIFGMIWYYLMLWIWGVAVLMALATAWTAVALVARWAGQRRRRDVQRAAVAISLAVAVVFSARLALQAPGFRHSDPEVTDVLAAVLPDAVDALERGEGAADGKDGRYLVSWNDAAHIGSQGYGLLNELERRGFDVGVSEGLRVTATAHRTRAPADATARVVLATGIWVDRWAGLPGATELASVDPRSGAARQRVAALRAGVIAELEQLDLDDLVPLVDDNLFGAAIDVRVPAPTQRVMGEMLTLGVPTAIFVAPPEIEP
jgi:hypothetical protein